MSHLEIVRIVKINERRMLAYSLRGKAKDIWSDCFGLFDTQLVR